LTTKDFEEETADNMTNRTALIPTALIWPVTQVAELQRLAAAAAALVVSLITRMLGRRFSHP
jgi:hypothetical protein